MSFTPAAPLLLATQITDASKSVDIQQSRIADGATVEDFLSSYLSPSEARVGGALVSASSAVIRSTARVGKQIGTSAYETLEWVGGKAVGIISSKEEGVSTKAHNFDQVVIGHYFPFL